MKRIRDAILLRMIQEQVDAALPESIVEITDPAEPGSVCQAKHPDGYRSGNGRWFSSWSRFGFLYWYLDTSVKAIDDVERALQTQSLVLSHRMWAPHG